MTEVALVIGGARGIGLATATALARGGYHVVIADIDNEAAIAAAAIVADAGQQATPCRVDAGALAELRELFAFIDRRFGRLDVLFSNFGTRCADGLAVSEAEFDHAVQLNLKSHYFALTEAAALLDRVRPNPSAVLMSSAAGLRFTGRSPLYSITKAALLMMARVFARELGGRGIRVNAVCPGPVDTEFPAQGYSPEEHRDRVEAWGKRVPLGHIASPRDVAEVVAFLASDESRYVTGTVIPVDGGFLA